MKNTFCFILSYTVHILAFIIFQVEIYDFLLLMFGVTN